MSYPKTSLCVKLKGRVTLGEWVGKGRFFLLPSLQELHSNWLFSKDGAFYFLTTHISINQKEQVYLDVQAACAMFGNQHEQNYKQHKAALDMKKKENQDKKDIQP